MANELQLISDLLKEINRKVDELPASLKVAAKQVFATELAAISTNAGLLTAGEFRVGNRQEPGYGFTGVRMAYPPMTYGGAEYPFVSVNNDVLQVGISLADGKLYAGAGNILIDSVGITIRYGDIDAQKIKFVDSTGYVVSSLYAYPESETQDVISLLCKVPAGSGRIPSIYFDATDSDENQATLEIGIIIFGYGTERAVYAYPKLIVGGDNCDIGITDEISGVSTGIGSILVNGTTARTSTGWLTITIDGVNKYIPFWDVITG